MIKAVLLDAGPLGKIAHPRRNPEVAAWFSQLLASNTPVVLPEIADYEVRRNLLLERLDKSLKRLDRLKEVLTYLPLTTEVMLKAAELWAEAKRRGRPTADLKELDGDVILAAQALQIGGVIATENIGHLSLFVEAKHWRDIT